VTVSDDEATVAVTEGLVEVSTPDQSDVEFVRPGFTALVSRENGGDIVIDHTRGEDQRGPEAPKNLGGSTQAVFILKAIGDVEVDVKEASSGLITNDLVPVDSVPVEVKDKDKAAADTTPIDVLKDTGKDIVAVEPIDLGPVPSDVPNDGGVGIGVDLDVVDSPVVDDVVDKLRGGNAFGAGKTLDHLKLDD
jgi:hypothetical protein